MIVVQLEAQPNQHQTKSSLSIRIVPLNTSQINQFDATPPLSLSKDQLLTILTERQIVEIFFLSKVNSTNDNN